jgi:hypothetical protein
MESKSESHKELEEVAPYLGSLSLVHPFIIPADYFEESEESILAAVKQSDFEVTEGEMLKHTALPFETPGDYFDRLPADIQNAIQREESNKKMLRPVVIRMQPVKYKTWLAAASVLLIGGLTLLFFVPERRPSADATQEIVSGITSEEDVSALENAAEIDEGMIINMVVDQKNGNTGSYESEDNSLIDISDIDPELFDDI